MCLKEEGEEGISIEECKKARNWEKGVLGREAQTVMEAKRSRIIPTAASNPKSRTYTICLLALFIVWCCRLFFVSLYNCMVI